MSQKNARSHYGEAASQPMSIFHRARATRIFVQPISLAWPLHKSESEPPSKTEVDSQRTKQCPKAQCMQKCLTESSAARGSGYPRLVWEAGTLASRRWMNN